jgi:2-polyprenyl-6-hydroxyphenyl methylase/3-demethylubiquinone-9 3-methyltransferase
LAELPRLDRKHAQASSIPCKVCGSPAPFFDVVDFNKCVAAYAFGPSGETVSYHRCDACGFLFTAYFDDWLPSDFARFIYNSDYAALDPDYASRRPIGTAELMAKILRDFKGARILDYGAGGGIFAERMAQLGFSDVASYDPFSMPTRPVGRFDIITCIEVIEHIPSPCRAIADMLSFLSAEGCILLGESLQPADIGSIRGNWWYVAPRNGHISTFADRTLAALARQSGLIFHRGAGFPHALRPLEAGPFAKLAGDLGPGLECYRLGAPGTWPATGFHGVEGIPGDQFQWTREKTLTWRITVPPGPLRLVQIMVPFMHQSRSGFDAQCRIEIAGEPAQTSIRESSLFAEAASVAPGDIDVIVHTPELTTSQDDTRQLGLAVKVTASV